MVEPADSIAKIRQVFRRGATIEEIEDGWPHVNLLEAHVQRYYSQDRRAVELFRRVKDGLSAFTKDARDKMPSPYEGWSVPLSALEAQLQPKFGPDGWPKR